MSLTRVKQVEFDSSQVMSRTLNFELSNVMNMSGLNRVLNKTTLTLVEL